MQNPYEITQYLLKTTFFIVGKISLIWCWFLHCGFGTGLSDFQF